MAAVADRVAVIDDQPDGAESTSIKLEDAGYSPVILPGGFHHVGELVDAVRSIATAAVCDHRLSVTGYAPFEGAEAVAALVEAQVPALLVTTYAMDFEVSIRAIRDRLPVVLNRSDLGDPDLLKQAFYACAEEIAGRPPSTRRLRRTLISLDKITSEEGKTVADAIIPAWNPSLAVRFPVSLMGDVAEAAAEGKAFFAMVNTGARRSEDLVLKNFSIAPDPAPDDGLG
jgi:CheY-like chemotaxis protein